jgi:peptidoglycan/LPS O-acetylase OafA/YrhL
MNNSVSANLDVLRAIAVCLVLAQHLLRRMQVDHIGWAPVTSLGRFGVLLFFVHTSLVLLRSLRRTEGTGWRLCRHFYIRRIFRIYPLSLLAVLMALALHMDSDVNGIAGLSHAGIPGKLTIISNLLLVQNWVAAKSIVNVLWSLPFELQMYVFLPLIFFWVVRERRQWVLISAWVLSVCVAEAHLRLFPFGPLSLLRFVPNFLPGVIAFRMPPTASVKSYTWPIFIAALILLYTLYPTDEMGWILCLVLGLGISQFQEISISWVRYVGNRIATYSYGVYISHQFAIWFSLGVLGGYSPWLRAPLLIVLLLGIPLLLYHTIEKPAIQFGTVLATRAHKPGTPTLQPTFLAAVDPESIVATVPN